MIDKLVQAVLYEGYILYPYRRSTKNQQRWTFGCLFPKQYNEATRGSEPCLMETQCLIRGSAATKVSIKARFLQLVDRTIAKPGADGTTSERVDQIEVDGKRHQAWQEAVERAVEVEFDLSGGSLQQSFRFPGDNVVETIHDQQGRPAAALTRTSETVEGVVEVESAVEQDDVYRITVRVVNQSQHAEAKRSRDEAQMQSMASTHAILTATAGRFISLIDPPPELKDLAGRCKQTGIWPVMVGEPGSTDTILASPIILYDYPQLAPESPGDLFDSAEIDEILSLRVMTLTDDEKKSASDLDDRAAALIGRTEKLAREQLERMHGTMRPPRKVEVVHVGNAEVRIGDHVRLVPTGRADAFDIILRGKAATIVAIEQDYEGRLHLAVTVDDDPGADIGAAGKIGHRFFFRPEEVEPLITDKESFAAP